ncbi:MAG: nondiscriminating glutamyl-tRNA synthetase [Gaiellales bacterium]|nr:nondiscriminating glutamyl-tRNA synthetase [Gaiellales bacterium]
MGPNGITPRVQSEPVASPVRTRFAPSPTGLLHVGGVRTALFSWLFARHNGGRFVLRIEDTDETREHPAAIEQIQRSLRWVGLEWDEGPDIGGPHEPYVQSERRARHHAVAEQFLADGLAYRCYCTAEELAAERDAAQKAGRPFTYSRRCLALGDAERAERETAGIPSVIRLRTPGDGECVVSDVVRGEVRFEYAQLGDHVIVRSDGVPTYNFVNPIDDADMAITHVIRGEDLLSSTPRQVLVYQGLNAPVPTFAHLPLLLGPDRKRLSKRHGATNVEELRDAGYLPEAVVNFLALMGWHFDSERELFTRDELIGLFSLERVNSAPAVFDAKKLEWMNGVYLRALPSFDLAARLTAFLRERGSPLADQPARISEVTPLAQEKISTLADFEPLCSFLFGPVERDEEAWARVAAHERAAEILAAVQSVLAACDWTVDAIEAALRGVCEQLRLKPKVVFGLVRVAVTGSSISPGLFESLHLLGRDEALARLAAAAARLG